jgi:aspartyl-tRNA(Asn)/glutamyl-tRNA(Gln) amidotransferase subunit B
MNSEEYKLTVGIECHVQLKSKTKLFSGANNDAKEAPVNTLINHIDFGLPGALPVLNKQAVDLALRAGFALNSRPQKFSKFDRKHYFYPDLPMGYQITQYDEPIILDGYVEFKVDNKLKRVNITRAHMEADAGKSIHPKNKDYSLVDLNRAGTPLLEIVSEPEMYAASEAKGYAQELYLLMRYADVSDANLYYGNMRFDVNVSVSKTNQLGIRTETKNLNSFKAVEKAIEYEKQRQIKVLEDGGSIVQETRGWDDSKNITYSMRSKENADDYRYMPDPDIPPITFEDKYLDQIEATMPIMPGVWRTKLTALNIDESIINSLLIAEVEYDGYNSLEELTRLDTDQARLTANYIVNIELPLRSENTEKALNLKFIKNDQRFKVYRAISKLVKDNKLSSNNAEALIKILLTTDKYPLDLEKYAEKVGLIQNSNVDDLKQIVSKVINANPKALEDIKKGQTKAIGFLVGSVMKESKGKANPGLVNDLIQKLI